MSNIDDGGAPVDIYELRANHLKIRGHTIILTALEVGAIIGAMHSACKNLPPEAEVLPILRSVLVRLSVVDKRFGPPPRRGQP